MAGEQSRPRHRPHGGSGLATLLNTPMPENFRVFFPNPDGEDSTPS